MCVYIYMYMYLYMCIYIYVYVYIYTYIRDGRSLPRQPHIRMPSSTSGESPTKSLRRRRRETGRLVEVETLNGNKYHPTHRPLWALLTEVDELVDFIQAVDRKIHGKI
jgi:hypothetical protein